MSLRGSGYLDRFLSEQEMESIVTETLVDLPVEGQRVLVIIPDHTRTMPIPFFFRLICRELLPRVSKLNFMVALGTHPPLNERSLLQLVGISSAQKSGQFPNVGLLNHRWDDARALASLGQIEPEEVAELSNGLMNEAIGVIVNRAVLEHDLILICGPVFPHELAGFSGGNKYFFPGVAGAKFISQLHWMGALLTSYEIIGRKDQPTRRLIDRAASLIERPRYAFCAVTLKEGVLGLFSGSPEEAAAAAADLAAERLIIWKERSYRRVLSVMPEMYDDLWVGSKGMYKVEPVVEEGGEVIIYAPHIREISVTHGPMIHRAGYHVRDYFLGQWERFRDIPRLILAHCTYVRGIGTFENDIEIPRVQVTLATGISEQDCRAVQLGYRDPSTIRVEQWRGREGDGVLLVERAGEDLYRRRESI